MAKLNLGLRDFMAFASLTAVALALDVICGWVLSAADLGATGFGRNWAPYGCSLFTFMEGAVVADDFETIGGEGC